MKTILALGVVASAVLWAPRARAQESQKFNAKALAAKYELPVYERRGRVVNNEIIESHNDVIHESTGIYAVREPLKRVLAFYQKKMGTPKVKTGDLGNKKYVFKKTEPMGSLERYSVIVKYQRLAHQTQITLWKRHYDSAADANY